MNLSASNSGLVCFALPLAGVILLAGVALWFWLGQLWLAVIGLLALPAAFFLSKKAPPAAATPAAAVAPSLDETEHAAEPPPAEDTPPPQAASAPPPEQLGPYRLGEVLGQGSHGTVYQCWRGDTPLMLAIKLFSPNQPLGKQQLYRARQQFLHGAQLARQLDHPNLLKVLDHGEEGEQAYLVMEHIPGKPLEAFLDHDKQGLPLPWAILIVAKLAMALDYLHRQHLVHADIKPANILFDPTHSIIKLMDFSLIRPSRNNATPPAQEGQAAPTLVAGTPWYMAPEQVRAQPLDGRADLFSLGTLFFQLLSGQLPFPAKQMDALLWQISREDPQDLRALAPDLPPCLLPLLQQALQKEPDERFLTGRAFTVALTACVRQMVAQDTHNSSMPD
ncbi:MAG: protein kinase [Magnetococcales bacterium]|nr:protein kinase [Magnetococcales bacterium]MBF0116863.1 protein kinase [Magnetococcales bacterium]